MHKAVILLVKAEDRDEAQEKIEEFLEPYGNGDVWDWYSIGGRWHNLLAPKDKTKVFYEKIHEMYPQTKGGYAINEIENDTVRPIIQKVWEDLGLKGKNPFWDAYGFSLRNEEEDYNIVPLTECQEIVKEWIRDLDKVAEETWEEMNKAREEEKKKKAAGENPFNMSGYYAGQYKDAVYDNFCFDSNVYDASEAVGEKFPPQEEVKEYWAVIVDMHN